MFAADIIAHVVVLVYVRDMVKGQFGQIPAWNGWLITQTISQFLVEDIASYRYNVR